MNPKVKTFLKKVAATLLIFSGLFTLLPNVSHPVSAIMSENHEFTSQVPTIWEGKYATVKNARYRYKDGKIQVKLVWGTKAGYTGYDRFFLTDASGNVTYRQFDVDRTKTTSGYLHTFSHNGSTFYYKEDSQWVTLPGAKPSKPTVQFNNCDKLPCVANLSSNAGNSATFKYDYYWHNGNGMVEYDPATAIIKKVDPFEYVIE